MRPPDDLTTLKNVPLAMLGAGLLVVPAMWGFVLDKSTLMTLAPITGVFFLLSGLHIKYRSRYTPREALWAFPLALIFFGSLLVVSTTALAWRMSRPDLQAVAVGLAALLALGGMGAGYWAEARRLAMGDSTGGIPDTLLPMLDLQNHRVRPMAAPRQPAIGRIAFFAALALNAPLLLQMGGWSANDVVWLAMPLLGGTVTYLFSTGFGPALARTIALLRVERRLGTTLCTSRLEELQDARRGFWLSRWLSPSGTA